MRYYIILNCKFSKDIVMKFLWIWCRKMHIFLFILFFLFSWRKAEFIAFTKQKFEVNSFQKPIGRFKKYNQNNISFFFKKEPKLLFVCFSAIKMLCYIEIVYSIDLVYYGLIFQ